MAASHAIYSAEEPAQPAHSRQHPETHPEMSPDGELHLSSPGQPETEGERTSHQDSVSFAATFLLTSYSPFWIGERSGGK